MERWGKPSRVAHAGSDSSFLPMEDNLQITWPWNIIRKKWVHDPDWHFQDGATPHLIWAHSDSEMNQEDLGKDRETLPRLIPSEWTLEQRKVIPCPESSWNQGTANKHLEHFVVSPGKRLGYDRTGSVPCS